MQPFLDRRLLTLARQQSRFLQTAVVEDFARVADRNLVNCRGYKDPGKSLENAFLASSTIVPAQRSCYGATGTSATQF